MQLLRWWARLELPGRHSLLQRAGVWKDEHWMQESCLSTRGKWHGYTMKLDGRELHQRGAYLYGRMLDVSVPLLLLKALDKGDTYIDVGANIGMTMLVAAKATGPRGHIHAFEPNPLVFRTLMWHKEHNKLDQAILHNIALSDTSTKTRLYVPATNCGAASIGQLPERLARNLQATHEIVADVGDTVLPVFPQSPMLIKLDVEGHETHAIRGLQQTIRTYNSAVLLECNVIMLPRSGTSVQELFALMMSFGYTPYNVSCQWLRFRRHYKLCLQRMPHTWRPQRTVNVLFMRPDSVHAQRLGHNILT